MSPSTVLMPKMGYDMTEGKITRWLKQEGDRVEKGEPIAEIETEKVNIQIEAFASGVLQKIVAQEGETVPVGQQIAMIGEPGEKPEEVPPAEALPAREVGAGEGAEAPPTEVEGITPTMEPQAAEAPEAPEEERVKASPVARRLAQEQGVELSEVQGTGPGGRITKEDVERFLPEASEAARRRKAPERPAPPPPAAERPAPPEAAPAPPAPAPAGQVEGVPVQPKELSRMGQAVARRMAESKRTAPHFYATIEIDMSHVVSLREELNRTLGEQAKISFNDFVMRATGMAVSRFPTLNASFGDGKLNIYQQINVAMAVALDEGLIAPVIKDCDRKPLGQIARESKELMAHVQEGALRQDEYEGATFTVSNMGMLGVESFAAIINPPQAAILAVGAVALRPVVRDGALAVAHTMKATISVDHRVANGADAARFLQEFRSLLEDPVRLLL